MRCMMGVMLHGGRGQLVVWMVWVPTPHCCLVSVCHGHLMLQVHLQLLLLGASTRLLVMLLLLLLLLLLLQGELLVSLSLLLHGC